MKNIFPSVNTVKEIQITSREYTGVEFNKIEEQVLVGSFHLLWSVFQVCCMQNFPFPLMKMELSHSLKKPFGQMWT